MLLPGCDCFCGIAVLEVVSRATLFMHTCAHIILCASANLECVCEFIAVEQFLVYIYTNVCSLGCAHMDFCTRKQVCVVLCVCVCNMCVCVCVYVCVCVCVCVC